MQEHTGQIASITTNGAYSISGMLMIDSWVPFLNNLMPWLDSHAGGMGVILATMTFLTNLIFKIIDRRRAV